MPKPKRSSLINPLVVIAGKNKLPQKDIDDIHWDALVALDAAKRGHATGHLANKLRDHVMTCVVLWAGVGNRALYEGAVNAWNALVKAFSRPTVLLDLTTTEYQAIRKAISYYLRAMPQLEAKMLTGAFLEAQRKLNA